MIKYKKLRWSNCFSYGADNEIDFCKNPLTQLLGKNGNGKSSIALILEEVQFNTNSKKVKKSAILNRHIKAKNYSIELEFNKDGVPYVISTIRTSSSGTVTFTCNGTDISSHTATGTYKAIEEVLGYDQKMFSQIVYQSSAASLEFLTATDTVRKKFLIELLSLTKYTNAYDVFRDLGSKLGKEVDTVTTKISTINSWLKKYEGADLSLKTLSIEEDYPTSAIDKVRELTLDLSNIDATNKKITLNSTKMAELAKFVLPVKPAYVVDEDLLVDKQVSLSQATIELASLQKQLLEGRGLAGTKPTSNCKTCLQSIDNSTRFTMFTEFEKRQPSIEATIVLLQTNIKDLNTYISKYRALKLQDDVYNTAVIKHQFLGRAIDYTLGSTLLDPKLLQEEIASLTTTIKAIEASITKTRADNKLIDAHNTKATLISEQQLDMRTELSVHILEEVVKSKELAELQILVKALSPTGLIAYKIECLVKDLEVLTNEYLGTLSDGRFTLAFKIESSDKLNVIITDNGDAVDILALSAGERARVNIATLLAIRKLMQALSNSRTNLLILDETISNLDSEGKELLIEVLLAEESLNTLLISHDFSHPLLEKIEIVKENNISRIEI